MLKLTNIKQLVVVCSKGETFKRGEQQSAVQCIENGCLIADDSGRISYVGAQNDAPDIQANTTIDCSGKVVMPGLVDAHTHPVWAGDRCHEFSMKLAGASYMEIHEAGGGIGFTVKHTKECSEEQLLQMLLERLDRMLRLGTTTVEGKGGYGLEAETELKLMRVLHRADQRHPVDIVSTYLGAHSVPKGKSAEEATQDVIERQLPALKEAATGVNVSLIDVFMETGVFDAQQTRRILEAGSAQLGLQHNFHGDELTAVGAAELAGELGSLACSHLEHVSAAGIRALARRPTFAVLLPTTAYILRIDVPPARALIEGNVPVALGTDFNPNAHCMSMPLTMHLAAVNMHMSIDECIVAATINSAGSMGRADVVGSLEVGKLADALILDAPSYHHLVYQMVDPPITHVIKKGKIVVEK